MTFRGHEPASVDAARGSPARVAAASPGQRSMWVLHELDEDPTAGNRPAGFQLVGDLDIALLRDCLSALVARHASLRTRLPVVDGQLVQEVLPPFPVSLPFIDLSGSAEPATDAERRMTDRATMPSHLRHEPSFDPLLLRLDAGRHLLHLRLHHAVFDGWSEGVLLRDLSALYAAGVHGTDPDLPPLEEDMTDVAAAQLERHASDGYRRELEAWTHTLRSLPDPVRIPRVSEAKEPSGSSSGRVRRAVADAVSRRLRDLARHRRVTLFVTLLTAYAVLLARYTGQSDLVVGVPVAARTRSRLEPVVGCLVNELPVRMDLSGDPTFEEALARVQRSFREAFTRQEVPFEFLLEHLRASGETRDGRPFATMFQLRNLPSVPPVASPVSMEAIDVPHGAGALDLSVDAVPVGDRIYLDVHHRRAVYSSQEARRVADHLDRVLEQVSREPSTRLSELSLTTPGERHRLLRFGTGPSRPRPEQRLDELVDLSCRRAPQAPAVEGEGEHLFYGDLGVWVANAATALRSLGVGHGTLVATELPRSPLAAMAPLAISRAGAAFLPLDIDHPVERRAEILRDARPAFVVRPTEGPRSTTGGTVVGEAAGLLVERLPGMPRRPRAGTAYVIYTSGTSGQPKGVVIGHRALANFLMGAAETYGVHSSDRWLQLATPSFDLALEEAYLPLITGGTLVIPPPDTLEATSTLLSRCDDEAISVLDLPTGLWHAMVRYLAAHPERLPRSLRMVIVGGEPLQPHRLAQWTGIARSVQLLNTYGPTEATVVATAGTVEASAVDQGLLPIGRPLPNVRTLVRDVWGDLAPPGVPGELCIAGAGLAEGYLDRDELTSDRFRAGASGSSPTDTAREYRTGDRAAMLEDGTLLVTGRLDRQVKVDGVRIEPGEVEQVMLEHAAVRDVAVAPTTNGGGLIAYVAASPGGVVEAALLQHCRRRLLPAAVPRLVLVDHLPTTDRGTVDLQALEESNPCDDGDPSTNDDVSSDPVGQSLTRLWARALGRATVPTDASFTDLGGTSLDAIVVADQIETELGTYVSATSLLGSTLNEIVSLARGRHDPHPDLVVPLGSGGAKSPLFAVHAAYGSPLLYRELATHLPDRPLFGLQSPATDGHALAEPSLEALAARYVDAIRVVQPHGPYHVLGYSVGAAIAFEMACQLHEAGDDVAFVGIGDLLFPPQGLRQRLSITWWSRRYRLERTWREGGSVITMARKVTGQVVWRSTQGVRRRRARRAVRRDGVARQRLRTAWLWDIHARALRGYQPRHYPGRLTLLRSWEPTRDPTLGWSPYAADGIEVIDVDGWHDQVWAEPYVGTNAARLQRALDEAAEADPGCGTA